MILTIHLTSDEAIALRQLLDRAVKFSGMQVAEACVLLDKKIVEAEQRARTGSASAMERKIEAMQDKVAKDIIATAVPANGSAQPSGESVTN